MQIVIDIDEETLQDLYDSRYVSPHIKDVFRSATPFPKGHGRLIDADACKRMNNEVYQECGYQYTFDDIDEVPTIIEADKEEKHEITD